MKNKKNIGWNNLNNLDLDEITKNANLKENNKLEEKDGGNKSVKKSLIIPAEFDAIIRDAKQKKLIIGSINSYIIEALRIRLIKDGLLIS
jgi:hypothetical protein